MVSDTFISSVKTTNSMPIMGGSHDLRSEDKYRGRKIKSHSQPCIRQERCMDGRAWFRGGVGNGAD